MATSYQAYGAGPGSSYPNAIPLNSQRGYPPGNHNSMESDTSDEMNVPYKQPANYSKVDVRTDMRSVIRTPSPTPSEQTELGKKHLVDFQAMKKRSYWFRREWLCECSLQTVAAPCANVRPS